MMKFSATLFLAVTVTAVPLAKAGTLRAGAAREDITPAADANLPMAGFASRTHGFTSIHDHIYVRAIVLDDGTMQAAIVAWEVGAVPDSVWQQTSQRISSELGIRPENLMLAAVHDHSSVSPGGSGGSISPSTPAVTAYVKSVEDKIVDAIRSAQAKLQPARFGFGAGKCYINVNRRESSPKGAWLGYNENGPSDKTVAVLRFEDLSGKPIAFLINYGVHAVAMGPENYEITGDLAGATSRFVEQHYLGEDHPRGDAGPRMVLPANERSTGDGPVAVWTSGSAGDQNPVATGENFDLVTAYGQILGETVVRVAEGIKTLPDIRIWGAQQVVTCPGRQLVPGPRGERTEYKFEDAPPVHIRLGVLMLGDVALTSVSGEVFTLIQERLKKESPFNDTVMLTLTNGYVGYIPDDSAFSTVSYEIASSRFAPGCAEDAIVNGLLDLMRSEPR